MSDISHAAGVTGAGPVADETHDIAAGLRRWAIEAALPLWADAGFDARRGGFQERLGLGGLPDLTCPRRTMVQARQIYVYANAAVLGWHDDAAEIALRGFEFLHAACRRRDGAPGYVHMLTAEGAIADATRDAYDHAFVLLALAWLARATGEPLAREAIDETLAFFDQHLADGAGAFHESAPARLPRRQNPHMHVFEALLALHETTAHPQALPRARAMVGLLEERFIDPQTRTIREFFDHGWAPVAGAAGDHIEPGHHAEWSWLLRKYQRLSGEPTGKLADDLLAVATRFADRRSGLVIDEADRFGAVRKATRRCWPQTELAKAWLSQHEAGRAGAAEKAATVLSGVVRHYLAGPVSGAWYDRIDEHGRPDVTFVPASTFYHLFGAIAEAHRVLGQPVRAE
jgi:mannose-6-phosphate isomerase